MVILHHDLVGRHRLCELAFDKLICCDTVLERISPPIASAANTLRRWSSRPDARRARCRLNVG
jgi:hypothetical protein